VTDSSKNITRYNAVELDVEFIRMRTFGSDGTEVETQTVEKTATKGHLNTFST
jgi:hypothetical protein